MPIHRADGSVVGPGATPAASPPEPPTGIPIVVVEHVPGPKGDPGVPGTIEESGTPLPARAILNVEGDGLSIVDDPITGKSVLSGVLATHSTRGLMPAADKVKTDRYPGLPTGKQPRVEYNVKDFGAVGDGVADDTAPLQAALDAIMLNPAPLFFPIGTYKITYSLQLVGDGGHNYIIRGECGTVSGRTRILWAGPRGCTMLDTWGLNNTIIEHLIFDGGGLNRNIGGSGVTMGAGCCIWLHTNQYNNGPVKAGVGAGAICDGIWIEYCGFSGIVGGLYPEVAIGDSATSPASMVVDSTGHYTLYRFNSISPPTAGDNAVDTYLTSTLTVQGGIGNHTVTVADTAPFKLGRAIIFSLSNAGQNPEPYHAMVSARSVSSGPGTVTFVDALGRGSGLPYVCPINTRVSNVYPNAPWDSGRHAPDTIVDLPSIIGSSQVSAIGFTVCWFFGGGSNCFNQGEYCYACIGEYGSFNTEQFWFRDCIFGTQAMVYGIYVPGATVNEFFVHNGQFGSFTGAAMKFAGGNGLRLDIDQCATESDRGCGYFISNFAGSAGPSMTVRHCESVYDNVANPYYAMISGTGYWEIEDTTFMSFFYNVEALGGTLARPAAIEWASSNGIEGCALTVRRCCFLGETFQVAIINGGQDVFAPYGGTSPVGTEPSNYTHKFSNSGIPSNAGQQLYLLGGTRAQIRLEGNVGTDVSGNPWALPHVKLNPEEVHTLGLVSNGVPSSGGNLNNGPFTYRSQPRSAVSCIDVDYTIAPDVLKNIYLATIQDQTIIESVVVQVTQTFSSSRSLILGTQLNSYTDIFNGVVLPAAGLPGNGSYLFLSAPILLGFQQGLNALKMQWGAGATLTTGHIRIWITTTVLGA